MRSPYFTKAREIYGTSQRLSHAAGKGLTNLKELEISFDSCWLDRVEQKPTAFDFMCICAAIGDLLGLERLGLKFSTWKIDDFQFDFLTERIERLGSLVEVDLRFGTDSPNEISYECYKRQMVVFSKMKGLKDLKLEYWVDKNEKTERLVRFLRPEQRKSVKIVWPEEIKKNKKGKNACCSLF